MMENWIFEGRLKDSHDEFFIQKIEGEGKGKRGGEGKGGDWWRGVFVLREEMIPEYISREFAEQVGGGGEREK